MKPIARTANSAPRGFLRTPVQCLVAEGRSSTGRAPVSKTGGSRFESWRPCGQKAPLRRGFLVWRLAVDNPRELRLVTRLEHHSNRLRLDYLRHVEESSYGDDRVRPCS